MSVGILPYKISISLKNAFKNIKNDLLTYLLDYITVKEKAAIRNNLFKVIKDLNLYRFFFVLG